ncbi:MAG: LapA family protein [Deltaproteobacteria bacterium]|jgi:hypothetical protein|nr:LapA family protein [Deltaproteobacteria bacterium]
MRFIKTFLLLVILIGMALFFLQNSAVLEQEFVFNFRVYVGDYGWFSPPVPFFFVVLMAFGLGGLTAIIMLGLGRFKFGSRIRQNKKRIRKLEKEVQALRELPLVDNMEINVTPLQATSQPQLPAGSGENETR